MEAGFGTASEIVAHGLLLMLLRSIFNDARCQDPSTGMAARKGLPTAGL